MGFLVAFISLFSTVGNVAHALTVSPARIEISGDPGQTINGQFNVINEQAGSQVFYTSAENFEAQGETGTPSFVAGNDGLASWISLGSQVSLTAAQQKTLSFTVTIPKDAEAGGYFAAIFLSTTPSQNQSSNVSVGAKIGVLVLLHVSGAVKVGGGLLGFSTLNSQRLYSSLPVSFSYRFSNSGSDLIQPAGLITVKNSLWLTSAVLQANLSDGNVLPGSIRKFTVDWNTDSSVPPVNGFWSKVSYEWGHFALGLYTAQLALTYGSKNTQAQSSFTFYVIPWHLLLVVIIILAILFLIFFKGIKSYNRYIISVAQRHK